MKVGKPTPLAGEICPFHKQDVSEVCNKCPLFVEFKGTNPNTGEDVTEWGCAFSWMPLLLVENSQQQRQTGAAVESFRNEMKKANDDTTRLALLGLVPTNTKLIGG